MSLGKGDICTQTCRQEEDTVWRWRPRSGWCLYQPRNTRDASIPSEAGREAWTRLPLTADQAWSPVLQPSGLWNNTFLLFKHPSLRYFVMKHGKLMHMVCIIQLYKKLPNWSPKWLYRIESPRAMRTVSVAFHPCKH